MRSRPNERSNRRSREIKSERPRPNSAAVPRAEAARPVGRSENVRPIDRTEVSGPRERLTRPRYRTPAERSPNGRSPAERPNAAIERRGPADGGDWRRHYAIDDVAPADPSTASVGRRRDHGKHPRGRVHGGRHGGHHHRHHYGCGHYGYGYHRHGYGYGYSPYDYGIGFGYYSPSFYLGLGRYWEPEVHVYGGSGGGSARYRDIGQGALDLDLRPETTEIYIDGSYVGIADEFDGFPTYLWLEEGTYEIAFYKEGHETIFRQYTIYPGVTIDVSDRMRPGNAVMPSASGGTYPQGSETSSTIPNQPLPPGADNDGRIAVVATPGDAAVYLDGHFVGTAAEISELSAGLIVEPGDHVIDIIRPGYDNQQVPVSVAKGERIDLQLDLKRP